MKKKEKYKKGDTIMKRYPSNQKEKEVMPTNKSLLDAIYDLPFPESLHEIHFIKPKDVTFDLIARLKCSNCGLYLQTSNPVSALSMADISAI